MAAVKFFSKKLQAHFPLTFPELVHGLRRGHIHGKVLFILIQNLPKKVFISMWFLKEPFFCLQLCYSSSVNGNFEV